MSDQPAFDFDAVPHARPTDPATSHEAIPANINGQCLHVLQAYRDGEALTDHEAYRRVGLVADINGARQRCTDLRHFGLIDLTGDRGATPSGKTGNLCRITQAGTDYLDREFPRWYGGEP